MHNKAMVSKRTSNGSLGTCLMQYTKSFRVQKHPKLLEHAHGNYSPFASLPPPRHCVCGQKVIASSLTSGWTALRWTSGGGGARGGWRLRPGRLVLSRRRACGGRGDCLGGVEAQKGTAVTESTDSSRLCALTPLESTSVSPAYPLGAGVAVGSLC